MLRSRYDSTSDMRSLQLSHTSGKQVCSSH
jgi:hypothetical protein